MKKNIRKTVFYWAVSVIAVLTLFGLCKIEGWMFKGGDVSKPDNSKYGLYRTCLADSNGSAGQQCAYVLK